MVDESTQLPVPKQYPHRFKPGQSGNPRGKPRGPNYATKFMESLKKGDSQAIIQAMVEKARNGSVAAAELILSRLMPVPTGRRVSFEWPEGLDSESIGKAFDAIMVGVGAGQITPDEGLQIANIMKLKAQIMDTDQIQKEIAELRGLIEKMQVQK
jgi:Family of unknown function (DUF5681)